MPTDEILPVHVANYYNRPVCLSHTALFICAGAPGNLTPSDVHGQLRFTFYKGEVVFFTT